MKRIMTPSSMLLAALFAYPEVRCDSSACAIPSYAYDVTAPLPPPPPAKDPADEED